MTDPAIRLVELTRSFDTVTAVDGLSLEVPAGAIFGFLGPNGAGKTTTIHLLLGLLEPTSGHVEVLGFDSQTHAAEIRARTGALLEHSGIYEQLSAEDNLAFYGRVWRMPAAQRQNRIKELLTHLDLWERRRERPVTWSRGMKQKLALARALLHRPALILLDEPTAGLDVPSAAAVRQDLVSLAAREGVTVFLTTHNMSEAEKLCAKVAVIRQGRLVAQGHPDELRAQAGGPRVQVTGQGFNDLLIEQLLSRPEVVNASLQNGHLNIDLRSQVDTAPLISLMVSAGASIEEVRRGKASLEEVFMTLMEETS